MSLGRLLSCPSRDERPRLSDDGQSWSIMSATRRRPCRRWLRCTQLGVLRRYRPPLVPHLVRARPDGKNGEGVSECSTSRFVLSRNSSAAVRYWVCSPSWTHWIMHEMVWDRWPDAPVGLCTSAAPICRPLFWDATAASTFLRSPAARSLQRRKIHSITVRVLTELDTRPGRFGRVERIVRTGSLVGSRATFLGQHVKYIHRHVNLEWPPLWP